MTDTWPNVRRMESREEWREPDRTKGGRDGEEVPAGRNVKSVIEEDSLHFRERQKRLIEV